MLNNLLVLAGLTIWSMFLLPAVSFAAESSVPYWQIRSIDTMKYSRDRAIRWATNPDLEREIITQIGIIKSLGANYITIDTPYDEEFFSYLNEWAELAHAAGLSVWFRGNWSGWEGWFGYEQTVTPPEHHQKTAQFIRDHPDLFEDGDIFDPCPECENGGHWDFPHDNQGYREFLIEQKELLDKEFSKLDKKVHTNIFAMNGWIARNVMNQSTLNQLGNLVTIDQYPTDASTYSEDVEHFKKLNTKIIIGEIGAPVPGRHPDFNEEEQAAYVRQAFEKFSLHNDTIIGVNYWVLNGGTTAIVNSDRSLRKAGEVVREYFQAPRFITGRVRDEFDRPIADVEILVDGSIITRSDQHGNFSFRPHNEVTSIQFSHDRHTPIERTVTYNATDRRDQVVYMRHSSRDLLYWFSYIFHAVSTLFIR
jgi:hypothetical protein